MSNNSQYIAGHNYQLAGSGISNASTSITLIDFDDINGNDLAMSDFGSIGYLVLEPKTSKAEIISFTGVTNNGDGTSTVTGVTRGLKAKSPYDAGGYGQSHSGGAIAIISNPPQFYSHFLNVDDNNTVNQVVTYAVSPTVPTPSGATDAANKAYVDNGVLQGAADASTTVKGIGRISAAPSVNLGAATITIASPAVITKTAHGLTANDTVQFTTSGALPTGLAASTTYYVISAGLSANAFEVAATLGGAAINTSGSQSGTHTLFKTTPIFVSDADPRMITVGQATAAAGDDSSVALGAGNKFVTQTGLQNQAETYVSSTGSANAYAVSYTPGPAALAAGQEFSFKANFANTGPATLNINGGGAFAIKKVDGVTALASGDIANGQIVKVKYDGTNWQMISPVGNAPSVFTPVNIPAVVISGTIVETNLASVSLPGGTLGTASLVKCKIPIYVSGKSGASAPDILRLKYGATTILSINPTNNASTYSGYIGYIEVFLWSDGSTSAQKAYCKIVIQTSNTANTAVTAFESVATGTAAEDSTAAKNFVITWQENTASSNDKITTGVGSLEKIS